MCVGSTYCRHALHQTRFTLRASQPQLLILPSFCSQILPHSSGGVAKARRPFQVPSQSWINSDFRFALKRTREPRKTSRNWLHKGFAGFASAFSGFRISPDADGVVATYIALLIAGLSSINSVGLPPRFPLVTCFTTLSR
jgi:hypothetical protein